MFNVSSVVHDNSLKTFFHSSMLLLMIVYMRIYSIQSAERVSAGQLFQIGVAASQVYFHQQQH